MKICKTAACNSGGKSKLFLRPQITRKSCFDHFYATTCQSVSGPSRVSFSLAPNETLTVFNLSTCSCSTALRAQKLIPLCISCGIGTRLSSFQVFSVGIATRFVWPPRQRPPKHERSRGRIRVFSQGFILSRSAFRARGTAGCRTLLTPRGAAEGG